MSCNGSFRSTQAEVFDLESAITDFLADPVRASLELPATLSAEQRKLARKAVDSNAEIKCESYGLGIERRLHLFKQAANVGVKNTFINDWIVSPGGENSEPVMSRSMPNQFSAFLDGIGKLDLAPIAEGASEEPRLGSPPCSTTATGVSSASSSPPIGSPVSTTRELPALNEGLHIRNTFIHMEPEPVNERAVQSMPHDMFRSCLLAETEAAAKNASLVEPVYDDKATAPSANPPDHAGISVWWKTIEPGTEVIIEGLVKLPAFNGLTGVVQSIDVDSGRYNVFLGSSGAHQWAKVKRENLRLAPPPPPRNPPTLDLDNMEVCQTSLPATPTWDEGSPLRLNVNALV